jgi:acyl-CoA reductase-like NAD-dependent aldehyde dehydrogenase
MLVNGDWQELHNIETSPVHNPSTGNVIGFTPLCTAVHVNDAVQAAAAAFSAWSETPPVERTRVLFRFKMLLEENFEDIARCNTREHGKTLIESLGDVRRGIEMVEFVGKAEGAKILADGRGLQLNSGGFFLGATVLDEVQNEMAVAREEIFGPVLNVMRADDLENAIETINCSPYGNGASIFTRSGKSAREFKHRAKAGMVGINISVPASMAWFPFAGWGDSFFGDLHMQGKEGVQFFTQQKVTTTRWFAEGEGSVWSTK